MIGFGAVGLGLTFAQVFLAHRGDVEGPRKLLVVTGTHSGCRKPRTPNPTCQST